MTIYQGFSSVEAMGLEAMDAGQIVTGVVLPLDTEAS